VPGHHRLGGRLRRVFRRTAYIALACALIVAGYLAFVGVRRTQIVALPPPAGDYRVGRTTFEWTDTSRRDPYAPAADAPRVLSVWVWYPAEPDAQASASVYAPGAWSGLGSPGPVALFEGSLAKLRPNSVDDPAAARGRFPIVVLEPGMGLSAPEFTALAEGIASEGYVVAGVTPTYSANLTVLAGHAVTATSAGNPSDLGSRDPAALEKADRLLTTWAADARFAAGRVRALDRAGPLSGHVDTGPVAYVGHSFGGAAALQACNDDTTCAGAADIDGTQFGPVARDGSRRPFLILGSDNSCVLGSCHAKDSDDRAGLATAQGFLRASTGKAYRFSILETKHFDFSDIATWYIAPPLRELYPLGSIDGRRALVIATAVLAAFLSLVHGGGPAELSTLASRYAEVRALP
jgi:predicted dienelactone hydrolase